MYKRILIASLFSLINISHAYVHKFSADGLEITAEDLSAQPLQKLVGTYSRRAVGEINAHKMFPFCVTIKNSTPHTFHLTNEGFSVKPWDALYVKTYMPRVSAGEFFASAGGFCFGAALLGISTELKKPQSSRLKSLAIASLLATTAGCIWVFGSRRLDQSKWLDANLIPYQGILVAPGSSVTKYVFFKEDVYDGNGVNLILKADHDKGINIELIKSRS